MCVERMCVGMMYMRVMCVCVCGSVCVWGGGYDYVRIDSLANLSE